MRFWTFVQYEAHGVMVYNPERGVTGVVIIQADDLETARFKFLLVVGDSWECNCCGVNWDLPTEEQGCFFEPRMGSYPIREWMNDRYFRKRMGAREPEVFVHLLTGEIVGLVYGTPSSLRLHRTRPTVPSVAA